MVLVLSVSCRLLNVYVVVAVEKHELFGFPLIVVTSIKRIMKAPFSIITFLLLCISYCIFYIIESITAVVFQSHAFVKTQINELCD